MKRKEILLLVVLLHINLYLYSQTYPSVSVEPWTTKNNQKGTFFKMVDWDTSPYEEFTYIKKHGPNSWEVTEYLNFRLLSPKGYNPEDDSLFPILIMLHGAGESGVKWTNNFDYANGYKDTPPEPEKVDNNDHQLLFGGKEFLLARNKDDSYASSFPGFVLFPQVQYNGAWAGDFDTEISRNNRMLIELVEILLSTHRIDPNRIYLTGLSNGARGVWDLITRRPDLFAAAIPLSGIGDVTLMSEKLAHFPIWLFQGGLDDNPASSAAQQMIEGLEVKGGTPRFTLYENKGHNVWDTAFTNEEFFPWLKSKSKLSIHVYHGKTHFGGDENIDVKLGISPGFSEYQWQKDGSIIAQSNTNEFLVTKPGTYRVRFSRGDIWTDWSEPVLITNDETMPNLPVVYRINAGGPSVEDEELDWDEDSELHPSPYLSPSSLTSNVTIENVVKEEENRTNAPSTLFKTSRVGSKDSSLTYVFPAYGESIITMFFARNDTDKNQRIFDIKIEGEKLISDFNVVRDDKNLTFSQSFLVNVVDSALEISLTASQGAPILSGIEVKGNFERQEIVTGIKDRETSPLTVYPNPFSEVINIKIPANYPSIETCTIFNALGKVVFHKTDRSNYDWIKIDNLQTKLVSGTYILELGLSDKTRRRFRIIRL